MSSDDLPQTVCPICAGPAEQGHLHTTKFLQWIPGEPRFFKDNFTFLAGHVGTYHVGVGIVLNGLRCKACGKIVVNTP